MGVFTVFSIIIAVYTRASFMKKLQELLEDDYDCL